MIQLYLSLFLLLTTILNLDVYGQEIEYSKTNNGYFQLKWANDFTAQTDYYYTNGLSFELALPIFSESPINLIMLPHRKRDQIYYSMQLKQDIFTPVEVNSTDIQFGDRPFASYLMMGMKKMVLNPVAKMRMSSELHIGLLGKASSGEQVQNGIHEILPTSSPVAGWVNQLNTDFAINYSATIEKQLFTHSRFSLNGIAEARLGVPYTDASVGLSLKVGNTDSYFQDLFNNIGIGWQTYFFMDGKFRSVLYNGTIEGGLFSRKSIYTNSDKETFLVNARAGLVISNHRVQFQVGQSYITREIKNGRDHTWSFVGFQFAL